ncbi:MAG: OmpA family protein [Hyphomicrobium sp.]|nr:OmpA family protein [Hyphomicrobium sp.]
MRRSLLVLIILVISSGALASGYAIWNYVSGDRTEGAATAIAPAGEGGKPGTRSAALTLPSSLPPGTSALLAIEVARIDAGGPSVLAGRAPPNHKVTLLANGREIATVTATDEGQWSAIVTEGISAGSVELSIVSQPKDGGASVRGAARQLVVPAPGPSLARASPSGAQAAKSAKIDYNGPAPRVAPPPIERPEVKGRAPAPAQANSDEAANKRALAEFEALVERTRKEVAAQQSASPSTKAENGPGAAMGATPQTASAQASPSPAQASAAPSPASAPSSIPEARFASAMPLSAVPAARQEPAPAAAPAPIPVPITFMTNAAALTPDGTRAASLLAEYLRLKRPTGITLSGHADARGPDGYNMRLSLRRLEAIQRYLRGAGYSGELSLLPRGKREPYQGIDRKRLPRYLIHQADRRVELRLTP